MKVKIDEKGILQLLAEKWFEDNGHNLGNTAIDFRCVNLELIKGDSQ